MWEQGNDPTQASANGPGLNPIARLDGQQLEYNYYAREIGFDPPTKPAGSAQYIVSGFAPFFWTSHEANDDAVPPESEIRWKTAYDVPPDPAIKTDPTIPVFFQASGVSDGAIMMVGDDLVTDGVPNTIPWNQRLAEMRDGRIAAKIQISLENGGADAVAGLMFRRQIANTGTATEADAYFAPGYSLNVNKAGTLQVVRVASQGASPTAVWTSATGVAGSTINTAVGAQLEIRTHNGNGNVEIWLNGQKVADYDDPNVIRGPHFGLFAQTATGNIKFSSRQVFDVGTEYVAKYTGYENGVLETDIEIKNADGVTSANQLYFAQLPSVWLANGLRNAAIARAYDSSGSIVSEFTAGAIAYRVLRGDDNNPDTPEPYALWLGSTENNQGIFGVPQEAWINGQPATQPHAQIDINNIDANNNPRFAIQMNPLSPLIPFPPSDQSQRVPVTSARMVTHWRPKLEVISPLLASIGDQSITEGNSGQKQLTFTVTLNRIPTQFVSVDYLTSAVTATAGEDYVHQSGTVVFDPADETTAKTISIPILGDALPEQDEAFGIQLSNAKHAAIGDGDAVGTILNDDVLPIPQIITPSAKTDSLRPIISWNPVDGATSYEVAVDNLSTGATDVVRTSTGANSVTPSLDLGIGSFRVTVRAINSAGVSSAWGSRNFRVVTQVILKGISLRQATARPQISWTSLPGAVKYDLWVDSVSTGQSQVIREQNLTTVNFTPVTDLPLGRVRAWVRGIDASGIVARWSNPVEFVVAKAPVPTGPLVSTFSRQPQFTWTAVLGAIGYDVYVRNLYTGATDFYPQGVTATSWTPLQSIADGPYRWWVQAVGQGNYRSLWGGPVDTYIGGRPDVWGPLGTTNDRTPTFSWSPVAGAATYQLWVNRLDVPQSGAINRTGISTSNFTPTAALSPGTYRIWIRAVSGSGEMSVWSRSSDVAIATSLNPLDVTNGDSILEAHSAENGLVLRLNHFAKGTFSLDTKSVSGAAVTPDSLYCGIILKESAPRHKRPVRPMQSHSFASNAFPHNSGDSRAVDHVMAELVAGWPGSLSGWNE